MYSRKLPKCRHDFAHVSKPILWFYGKFVLVPCVDSDSIGRHKASGRQESEYRWFLKADTTAFPSSSAITAFYDLENPLLVICITSWPDMAIALNETKLLKREFLLNGKLVINQNNPTTFPLLGSRPTSQKPLFYRQREPQWDREGHIRSRS